MFRVTGVQTCALPILYSTTGDIDRLAAGLRKVQAFFDR
jgi:hypothetical protein